MAKNTEQICLKEEDARLFEKAVKKYGMKRSALLKEIVHAWLFANKLSLEKK
jgi:hypothetical protein